MMSLTFGLFTQVSGSGPLGPLVLLYISVVVLRPWYITGIVMSGWSVNLTTLFLGRLRPPKRLTSALPAVPTPTPTQGVVQ